MCILLGDLNRLNGFGAVCLTSRGWEGGQSHVELFDQIFPLDRPRPLPSDVRDALNCAQGVSDGCVVKNLRE